jgi:predicted amidohydrolase
MKLRIAGAQLPVTRDVDENLKGIFRALEFAVCEGADLLLTPEGSLSGYTHEIDLDATQGALMQVTGRAKSEGVALALGTCFVEEDGKCYNQIRFYEKDGEFLGFHSKTLTCGSMTDSPRGEINHYAVKKLETFQIQGVKVGGLICNDLWANPGCTPIPDSHLTHQLANMGAQVIVHAVNGGRNGSAFAKEVVWPFHQSNLQLRARASKVWIATVDSCYPRNIPCSAPSGVVDPGGQWAVVAESISEQFYVYTIGCEGE